MSTVTPDKLTHRDAAVKAITEALSTPFTPRDVRFKPQMVKNNRALAIAYVDVRLIEDRLDQVLGAENWQDEYENLPDGSVVCRLKLKLGGEWITKVDVGSPSEQPDGGDRLKAAFSDALKRAAVKFGVGRYLYRLPPQWVEYDPAKKQITQPPQLPAFALPPTKPSTKSSTTETAPAPKEPTRAQPPTDQTAPVKESAPVQTPASGTTPPKEAATKPAVTEPGKTSQLPGTGQELHRRLREYDSKLASQKLCQPGALLAHVTQAGVKAGYSANMTDWTGPAIPFAVEVVKEFDQTLRAGKTEPRTAA